MMHKDPQIKVTDALELVNGNQSKLAAMLGVNRAAISEWKKSKRIYVPALQAYRLLQMFPEQLNGDAA